MTDLLCFLAIDTANSRLTTESSLIKTSARTNRANRANIMDAVRDINVVNDPNYCKLKRVSS